MEEKSTTITVPMSQVFVSNSLVPFLKKLLYSIMCAGVFAGATVFYKWFGCSPGTHLLSMILFIVFMIFVELLWNEFKETRKPLDLIFKYAIYGSLLFYFISSKDVYLLTQKLPLIGGGLADSLGCPTGPGIVVHGILFAIALLSMLGLPKDQ